MSKAKPSGSRRARRAFSSEFKVEAVRLMRERRAAGASGRDGFPGNGPPPGSEAEVRRLQRENAVLRQERDFLKKAAAFFAKESR
ncbi:MAG TPA: hypothetical protein VJL31_17660 [Gemmatimonadales bacterium]|jgi:transposase-like protein|nr:hypothetical protein [Gemmatimonadales bacterium]